MYPKIVNTVMHTEILRVSWEKLECRRHQFTVSRRFGKFSQRKEDPIRAGIGCRHLLDRSDPEIPCTLAREHAREQAPRPRRTVPLTQADIKAREREYNPLSDFRVG